MNSFYVVFGSVETVIQIPVGTAVNNVEIDGVDATYIIDMDTIVLTLTGIAEGAHLVTITTDAAPIEAVMCLYNQSVFFEFPNGAAFAKIIKTHAIIAFNQSIARSKIFFPAQAGKTMWGIPLKRMSFASVPFVPISQMISLGTFSGMTFDPVLSMRLKYTVTVPFDPIRNAVTLWRYFNEVWEQMPHEAVTDRYIEFIPEPPGVYVASIPKPIGLMEQDMRGLQNRQVPSRYPGRARYGTA